MKRVSFALPLVLLLVLSSLPGLSTRLSATTLVLKKRAVVSDHIVRIKDIASMDKSTRSQYGNLVVAVSPEMGRTGTIEKREIYEKLVGNGFRNVELRGPSIVTIVRKGSRISPGFFKKQIYNYIITHSKWKSGIQVTLVSKKEVVVPETGVKWRMTPANGQDFFGNILFKVEAFTPATNELIYSNWIVAKLKIVQKVAISNRTIQKNERLSPGDFRWETREITAFFKDALFTEKEIVGEKAGRMIRPNSVITAGLLEKKFLVKRGAGATLVANFKNIKATSTVKVMSNGVLGDTVRVINHRSKKIISATVVGKNKVEVTVE